MKLAIRLILLQTALGFSILSGQSLTVLREYKTHGELHGVIARPDTNAIDPKLYVFQNNVTDSETGKILFLLKQEDRPLISANMRMLAIYSPREQPAGRTEPRQFELSVFSAQNKSAFRFQDRYRNQGKTPSFFLNESKQAILQVSPNGDRLKIFDNHGRLLREKSFSQDRSHNYENSIIRFNADGNRLAFYTRVFDMDNNRWDPMLFLLSSIGEEIRKTRLILKRIDDIAISRSGKFVAVAGGTFRPVGNQSEHHIFVFDSLGKICNSLPYRAVQITFDSSERHLLIRNEQNIKIVDLNSDGIQTSVNICGGRREIADITFLNDSSFAVSSGTIKFRGPQKIYDCPSVQIYSAQGFLMAEKNFPNTYSYTADIYKSLSGQQIGFCLQNSFNMLQLNQ